jgi:endogenous inhibitor of DNA gyrase (YacG/DUF329 family)
VPKPKSERVTVTCANCGQQRQVTVTYASKSATGIFFCGNECRKAYAGKIPHPGRHVARIEVACEMCGEMTKRTTRQAEQNQSGRFFCSAECHGRAGKRPTVIKKRPCEICGREFKPASRTVTARFCSRDCQRVWQSRRGITRICPICDTSFRISPSRAERTAALYCSQKCQGAARTKTGIGRLHNGRQVTTNTKGYALIYQPDHYAAHPGNGRTLEHRWVMEQHLGRRLSAAEQVHHVNGDKTDNRPENLQVLVADEHTRVTLREGSQRRRAAQARIRELEAEIARLREAAAD